MRFARHRPGQIVREELEHRFLELVHAAGLPDPETNVRVKTRRRTYRIDCLWREEGVAVELDGRAAHARAAAFEEDRARDAALSAMGLRAVRFTWRRVTGEGDEVKAELGAMLSYSSSGGGTHGGIDATLGLPSSPSLSTEVDASARRVGRHGDHVEVPVEVAPRSRARAHDPAGRAGAHGAR